MAVCQYFSLEEHRLELSKIFLFFLSVKLDYCLFFQHLPSSFLFKFELFELYLGLYVCLFVYVHVFVYLMKSSVNLVLSDTTNDQNQTLIRNNYLILTVYNLTDDDNRTIFFS